MADNTTLDAGSGGDTIRTDDIGGIKYPVDKIAFGADGSATLVDGSGNGLPVLLKNSSGTEIGVNAAPVQVGDAGGSLTVDGTVAATQSGTWTVTGTGGTFPVTDSGGSLTVDGTVAATQSGTWTVQPGNTANTTAWKVDGSAVTQPVSASSLPLPTGASTAAKQPALGFAGTAASDVITVQGIGSMTPLQVADNGGSLTVDGTVGVSGTVAVTQSGTWDEIGINDSGNSITVDNSGTFAVQSADRNGVILRPTITTSATPDYSANDVVSGIVTLSSVMSASGRQAVLKSLVVKDASGQAPALSFMFFRATPSGGTYTDNSALVWGTNDLSNMTGVVRVLTTDWYTLVSKSLAAFGGLDQLMGSANSDLYMLIVADATWNAAATTDLTVELAFEQR